MRSKQRAQSVVEFGLVSIWFILLVFGCIDFGLLLNTWVRVSAATREAGRLTSVGGYLSDVDDLLRQLVLPGVSQAPDPARFPDGICQHQCSSGSKVVRDIVWYDGSTGCVPPACSQLAGGVLDDRYFPGGGCHGGGGTVCPRPQRGDWFVLTISAPGMEVLTPPVRALMRGCDGSQPHCYVDLGSTVTMRFEGV
jgi:hypothetical protein